MKKLIVFTYTVLTMSALAAEQAITPIYPVKISKTTALSLLSVSIPTGFIHHAGAASLSDVLQSFGMAQLNSTNEHGQSSVSLRGFGTNASSNSLIILNGIPLTNPDLASPNLNLIPLNSIQSIQISAGSEGVLYGDQAVGGVINITSLDDPSPTTQLSCILGGFGQRQCSLQVRGNASLSHYSVDAMKIQSDGYRKHSQYLLTQLQGQVAADLNDINSTFNYQLADEYMAYPGPLSRSEVHQNRRQALTRTDYFKNNQRGFQLSIIYPNAPSLIETQVAFDQMQGHGLLGAPFNQARDHLFLQPKMTFKSANRLVVVASDIKSAHYRLSSAYGKTRSQSDEVSLFNNNTFSTGPFITTAGFRFAKGINQISSAFLSRFHQKAFITTLGTRYPLSEVTSIYLRRAGSFRFPKADENASRPTDESHLKTQIGYAYETGIKIKKSTQTIQFDLYQLNLKHEIAYDPTQTLANPFGVNRNLPPTKREGLGAQDQMAITRQLSLFTRMDYVHARFQKGIYRGKRIPMVAETALHLKLDYQTKDCLTLFFESNSWGSQYPANDNGNLSHRLGGYSLFNIGAKFQWRHLESVLRLNNLLNKFYNGYSVYLSSTKSDYYYPAPGFNFALTMNYVL